MYSKISEYYEKIFPRNQKKLDFLKENLNQGSILDLACGSGMYVNELKLLGFDVTGFDLDKSMIEQAQKKYPTILVKQKNMLELDDINRYDGIYSIGNSIVHLDSLSEIKTLVKKIYQALKPGGKLILQIINYNRIIKKKITNLPTIEFGEGRFVREYEQKGEKILFKTTLFYDHKLVKEQVELLPLQQEDLVSILQEQGFTNLLLYGDFLKNDYIEKESLHLIITALK